MEQQAEQVEANGLHGDGMDGLCLSALSNFGATNQTGCVSGFVIKAPSYPKIMAA